MQKTITDRGATDGGVTYRIDRNPLVVAVEFVTTDGDRRQVVLTQADVIAATTAGERSQLTAIFDTKLYVAALAKAGFA